MLPSQHLPSCSTLRDYKNAIKPHAGFNPAIIQELIKTTELFTGHQRNIVVIRRNEDSAEPGVGDPDLDYASFKNQDDLATPVLVFMSLV